MKHAAITFDNDSFNTGKCILGPCWSSLTSVDQSKVAICLGQCHFRPRSNTDSWAAACIDRFSQQKKYKKKKMSKLMI